MSEPRSRRPGAFRCGEAARSLDVATGVLVLVVYAVAHLALLQGPHPFDPAKYFRTAVDFPDVPADLWTLRIGLVAPTTAAVRLLGPSEAALYGVPLVVGLLLAAAVYGTMLLLFGGRVVAAAAALVAVLNPAYLLNSVHIFPDPAATATFTAGFFSLVLGGVRAGEDGRGWVQTVAALAAGVLFGWTYLIREFSPILVPAVLVAVVLLRYPLGRVASLAGATLATASLELLYGLVQYGRPLIHAEELLARGDEAIGADRVERVDHIQAQLDTPLDVLLVLPRLLLAWRSGWLVLLLVPLFVVALVLFRDRRLWLLAAWCLGFWAIMAALGAGSLPSGRWILNTTNIRYWSPIFPPLAMGAFAAVALLAQRYLPSVRGIGPSGPIAVALAALVLTPGLVEYSRCADRGLWTNDPAERWDDLRSWLATPEAARYDTILTDGKTHRLVPAFARTTFGARVWDGTVTVFPPPRRGIAARDDEAGSLILIHKRHFPERNSRRRLDALRGEWSPVFATADGNMVLLAHVSVTGREASPGDQAWWNVAEGRRVRAAGPGCGLNPYVASLN